MPLVGTSAMVLNKMSLKLHVELRRDRTRGLYYTLLLRKERRAVQLTFDCFSAIVFAKFLKLQAEDIELD